MRKVIAIVGSQGTGKSTLLNQLASDPRFSNSYFVSRKTSRSILEQLSVSLDQVNQSIDLTMKFQDLILSTKIADDTVETSADIVFTERSFADLFVYMLVNLGKYNQCSQYVNNYYNQCVEAQQIYSHIIYLQGGLFAPQQDGVRSTNQHYSRMVDLTMLDTTRRMCDIAQVPLITIDFDNMQRRIDTVNALVRK